MNRFVVTGGSGFIGRHLVKALLAEGHQVTVLSRHPESATGPKGVRFAAWQPLQRGAWYETVDGVDAVVHLAGEPAVGQRWTEAKKQAIYESRVRSTEQIVEAIGEARDKPQVLLCASAVGYYGYYGPADSDVTFDETAAPGNDFLARVCRATETVSQRAAEYGLRAIQARFGVVLGPDGGALQEMAKPFKAFLGGPIGSGHQMVSWIHIDDLVGVVLRCLKDESVRGPVNVTAPKPVTNEELSEAIGHALHRPSRIRAPGLALKLLFKDGSEPLLQGQRVLPAKLRSLGYDYQHGTIDEAVRAALSPRRSVGARA